MDNPYLSGNFAPVTAERTEEHELEIEGVVPPDLEGQLLRNGPNPAVIPADQSEYHWFSGDGMIHAIGLEGGKAVSYRNRWVRTRKLAAECNTAPPKGPSEPIDGPANTHVIRHAGRTLALVESGFPHALSPDLERARIHDFDGSLASPMTAHPKVDPTTGELIFFGYDVFGPPFLRSHVVDSGGVLIRTEEIDVPRAVMMHDFGVTATRMVFLDLPVVFDLDLAVSGQSLPFRWMPEAGARVGLLARGGRGSDIQWIGMDPCYVFHVLNAFDIGASVVSWTWCATTPPSTRLPVSPSRPANPCSHVGPSTRRLGRIAETPPRRHPGRVPEDRRCNGWTAPPLRLLLAVDGS